MASSPVPVVIPTGGSGSNNNPGTVLQNNITSSGSTSGTSSVATSLSEDSSSAVNQQHMNGLLQQQQMLEHHLNSNGNSYLQDTASPALSSESPITTGANVDFGQHAADINGLELQSTASGTGDEEGSIGHGSNGLPRCTGCKSKKLDAVAKCIECANYLCANCVTAHQFMHCFDGHSVFRIESLQNGGVPVQAEPHPHAANLHNNLLNGGHDVDFHHNSHQQQQHQQVMNGGEDEDLHFMALNHHHHLQAAQQQQQQHQLINHHHHQQMMNGVGGNGVTEDDNDDLFHDQQFLANKIMNSFGGAGIVGENNALHHRLAMGFKDEMLGLGSVSSCSGSSSSSSSVSSTTATGAMNFAKATTLSNKIIGSGLQNAMQQQNENNGMMMGQLQNQQQMQQQQMQHGRGGLLDGVNGMTNGSNYFCLRHKNELLKYFCRTCHQQSCKDCIVIEHQGHEYELLNACDNNVGSLLQQQSNGNNSVALSSSNGGKQQMDGLMQIVTDVRQKATDVRQLIKNSEYTNQRLLMQYRKAQNEINETHNFFRSMLEDRKQNVIKELENMYNCKTIHIDVLLNKTQEHVEKVLQSCEFVERLSKQAGPAETIMLRKVMENKLQSFLQYVQDLQNQSDLEFVSNYQAIQVSVRNSFGYIRSSPEHLSNQVLMGGAPNGLDALTSNNNLINSIMSAMPGQDNNQNQGGPMANGKQPPIARPSSNNGLLNGHFGQHSSNGGTTSPSSSTSNGSLNMGMLPNGHMSLAATTSSSSNSSVAGNGLAIERPFSNGNGHGQHQFDSLSKRFNSLGPFVGDILNGSQQNGNSNGSLQLNPYEKWSNGGSDIGLFNPQVHPLLTGAGNGGNNGLGDQFSQMNLNGNHMINDPSSVLNTTSVIDLTSKLMTSASSVTSIFPPKSQIKRQKMIYHCKFGEFGVMEGQFTEPSGVAVNAQNDIIVADTNNHRIQIFDKEGRFKFQFGECGKRDGQLLYPNRVAVVRTSGDIIVTERSPTHQIQIYNQYGQFVRKFGANILQHPRGVTVDNKGRIIVVECKVMRVIIFDQNGVVLQKFGCSKHLEFPNGVVVNDKQEIFISDNRAHCVKVFNYEGVFLRQIGGEGITNYPIGVGINQAGEILIADNHNNFNLTIFTQDGQLVSALESKVKHAQCFDVALMDDGSVVLASKDYRLYIYRYVQVPPIGL